MTNELLRHTIATISYRFQKVVKNSNENFGEFKIGEDARTPNEIINHMFDLINKTQTFILEQRFNSAVPASLDFPSEIERFLLGLRSLDNILSKNELDLQLSKRLLQGPLLDVLTHIGQIAMLNGLNGNKIEKEDYSSADVSTLNL